MQTFLSSSSSRRPHPCRLRGARRPASPPSALPGGRRAPGRAALGAGPTPRCGPAAAGSRWPTRAGAPRSCQASRPARRRPEPASPRRPPRRPPCAGCPETRAPAAAPRATCRRARAGAARSGCTSPAQVRAAGGAGGGGPLAGGGDSPGRPRALAPRLGGGREQRGAVGERQAYLPTAASLLGCQRLGALGQRCSSQATLGRRRGWGGGAFHPASGQPRVRQRSRRRGELQPLWFLSVSSGRDFGPSEGCGPLTFGSRTNAGLEPCPTAHASVIKSSLEVCCQEDPV